MRVFPSYRTGMSILTAALLTHAAAAQVTHPPFHRNPPRILNEATLFFTEGVGTTPLSFGSATVNGRIVRSLADNEPITTRGIAFDERRRHVYIALGAPATIERMNLDGTGRTTIPIAPPFPFLPRGVDVDEVHRRIYWISPGVPTRIGSCRMDGLDPVAHVQYNEVTPVVAPRSIHVDGADGKIYWWEPAVTGFRSADLNGANIQTVLSLAVNPYAVDVDTVNDDIYWTYHDTLYRVPIDGSAAPQAIIVDSDIFDFDQLAVSADLDLIAWFGVAGRIRWTKLSGPGVVHESPYIGFNAQGSIELAGGPPFVFRIP